MRLLRSFIHLYVGAVLAALVPVVLATFLPIPYTLGGHPGEARAAEQNQPARHT